MQEMNTFPACNDTLVHEILLTVELNARASRMSILKKKIKLVLIIAVTWLQYCEMKQNLNACVAEDE